jgi:hypothetical protein
MTSGAQPVIASVAIISTSVKLAFRIVLPLVTVLTNS